MRWIYISPHFDDAVLSCGGLIWEQTRKNIPVEAWTVCAGDPPAGPLTPQAEKIHREWGTSRATETVALRRAEDKTALQNVGAAWHHFTVPDCIYRRSPEGEALYPDRYTGPRHPAEAGLPAEIAASLSKELLPDDRLVCPLTVGGHLDHVLVRDAAEKLGRPLWYYAEIPYLLDYPQALGPVASGLEEIIEPISEDGLDVWLEGISAYASQVPALFKSDDFMRARMRSYWKTCHGVRLWHPG
jgi:LmbE family N-acetylglucosaminyl deacetylase